MEFKVWVADFMSRANKIIDAETAMVILVLTLAEHRGEEGVVHEMAEKNKMFTLVSLRADAMHLKISPWCCVLLSALCTTPGQAVMYLEAISYKFHSNTVSCAEFCMWIIPKGIISEQDLSELWDLHKTLE